MKQVVPGLVSVIVPSYNAAKFLTTTIQSVISQTYTDWELILVDDGSTDTTCKLLESFLSDTRIQYLPQKNSGVSSARNAGLALARGQWIAFLDADDFWLAENLSKKIQALTDPSIDYVFSNMYHGDVNLTITKKAPPGSDQDILKHLLLWDREVIPTVCSNVVFKRICFESGLQFDESFSTAADQDFAFYLASSFRGKLLPECLYIYRILPDSMSRNIQRLETDHLAVYRKAQNKGLFSSLIFRLHCFSNLYLILAGNWWKNGGNKPRSMRFIFFSVCSYPPIVFKLGKKLLR
jgi:glycosyltransferase involved in cell wall biosynthesis